MLGYIGKHRGSSFQSHLDQFFTLDQLADALGLSVYYFCRQFKQSMDITPHQLCDQTTD
ncbi:MAG: helix-turn-helix transcriptional regulator [Leptolyngbyaceae cyanobacterium CSU_1_3]|nr:helix-turn-helix transcriptional regulator [Leptolyngbyaceae cyanobacterium CSU_1_3]